MFDESHNQLFIQALERMTKDEVEKDLETYVSTNVRPFPKDVALIEVLNELQPKGAGSVTYSVDFANGISNVLARLLCNPRYHKIIVDAVNRSSKSNEQYSGALGILKEKNILKDSPHIPYNSFLIGKVTRDCSTFTGEICTEEVALYLNLSFFNNQQTYFIFRKVYKKIDDVLFCVEDEFLDLSLKSAIQWAEENLSSNDYEIEENLLVPKSEQYLKAKQKRSF